MKRDKVQNKIYLVLILLITLLAIGARIVGLSYDRLICFNHDEQIHLLTAEKIFSGNINPRDIWEGRKFLYVFYPWLSMYIVAGVYYLYDIIISFYSFIASGLIYISGSGGRFFNIFSPPAPLDRRSALYLGRLTIALIGAANIPLVYLIGKKLWDRRTGLLAGAILALNGYHVANCHWMKNDIIATFFLSAAFFFAVRIFLRGRVIDYILAGVFSAVAMNAKSYTIPVLAVCLLAHLARSGSWDPGSLIRGLFGKKILFFALALILVFIATYPLLYLDFNYIVSNLKPLITKTETQAMFGGLGAQAAPRTFLQIRQDNLVNFTRFSWEMEAGMGGYVFLLGLGGILVAGLTRKKSYILTASFPVLYLVSAVLVASPGIRYQDIIPLLPFFALLAAGFIRYAFQYILRKSWLVTAAMLIGGLVLLIPYGRMVARMDYGYWERSIRYFATRWAARNIPPGSAVITESKTLALDSGRYRSAKVRALWDRNVDRLKEAGVDYLVVASRHERRALEETGLFGPDHPYGKFYLSLPSRYDLIKEFDLGVIPYRGGGSKIWELHRDIPLCPSGLDSGFLLRLQNDLSLQSPEIIFPVASGRCQGNTSFIVPPEDRRSRRLISSVSLDEIGVQAVNGFREGEVQVRLGLKKVIKEFDSNETKQFLISAAPGFPFIRNSYHISVSSPWNSPCLVRVLPGDYRIGLGYFELGDYEKAVPYLIKAAASAPGDWYPRYLLYLSGRHLGMGPRAAAYRREIEKLFPDYVLALEELGDERSSARDWEEDFKKWTGYPAAWIASRAGYIWYKEELLEEEEGGGDGRLEKSDFYLPDGEYRIDLLTEVDEEGERLIPEITVELIQDGRPFRRWMMDGDKSLPEMIFSAPDFGPSFTLRLKGNLDYLSGVREVYLSPTMKNLRSRVTAALKME